MRIPFPRHLGPQRGVLICVEPLPGQTRLPPAEEALSTPGTTCPPSPAPLGALAASCPPPSGRSAEPHRVIHCCGGVGSLRPSLEKPAGTSGRTSQVRENLTCRLTVQILHPGPLAPHGRAGGSRRAAHCGLRTEGEGAGARRSCGGQTSGQRPRSTPQASPTVSGTPGPLPRTSQ